jgi:hypothetical protein
LINVYPCVLTIVFPGTRPFVYQCLSSSFSYRFKKVNAQRGMMPFSDMCYGVGMFTSAAFFNHACQPNAVMTVLPNSIMLQPLSCIEAGDEITVAYTELPLEMLSPNLVRMLHMRTGAIVNELGCRCETCRLHLQEEGEALAAAGQDPQTVREVSVDMKDMWLPPTAERLKLDERLLTYVMAMINVPKKKEGMHASNGLRMYYEHYLAPPKVDRDTKEEQDPDARPPSFCPDLAYVMADTYCRSTIHYPGQEPDNYLFWTALYNDLLQRTVINMPKTLTDALGARSYVALLISARLDRNDTGGLDAALGIFLEAWLMLRRAHSALYNHKAFLTLLCMAYPNIGQVVNAGQDIIKQKEMLVDMQQAMEAAQRAQTAATQAQAQAVEQPAADDMHVPSQVMDRLEALDRARNQAGENPQPGRNAFYRNLRRRKP